MVETQVSASMPIAATEGAGTRSLAFIVDADNVSPAQLREMLAEAAKYGTPRIRRVYGNWSSSNLAPWAAAVREHALVPFQQFTNISGKNSTDIAMVIDAMDILHGGHVQAFCIVSSDSDYTRLATRIREHGLFVMGIGAEKTPQALRNAYDVFILTENLDAPRKPKEPSKKQIPPPEAVVKPRKPPEHAVEILTKAWENTAREDGWAYTSALGWAAKALDPLI